jgi:hypothetical protein
LPKLKCPSPGCLSDPRATQLPSGEIES